MKNLNNFEENNPESIDFAQNIIPQWERHGLVLESYAHRTYQSKLSINSIQNASN